MSILNSLSNYGEMTNFRTLSRAISKEYIIQYWQTIINSLIKDDVLRAKLITYTDAHFGQINDLMINEELMKIFHPTDFWLGIYDIITGKVNSQIITYDWRGVDNIVHSTANYQYFATQYSKELKKYVGPVKIELYSYMFTVLEWLISDVYGRVEAFVYNTKIPNSLWVGPVTHDHLMYHGKIPRDHLLKCGIGNSVKNSEFIGLHGRYSFDLSTPPFNVKSHTKTEMLHIFSLFGWGSPIQIKGSKYSMYRGSNIIELNKLLTPATNKDSNASSTGTDYPTVKDAGILCALCFLTDIDAMFDIGNFKSFHDSLDKKSEDINSNFLLKCFSKHGERTSLLDVVNILY